MSRRFRCGLVVGKFCPLHLGHEMVINHALDSCDEIIVISYTKPGFHGYTRALRESWLRERFPDATCLVIDDASLSALCQQHGLSVTLPIPEDDAPDNVQRLFVAWICNNILHRQVDSVFTSEDYGDGFAHVLAASFGRHVEHVCVDKARLAYPVSGTKIRSDPHAQRGYMSPHTYASFVRRICILGGESTGKTTIARSLAQSLHTVWAAEYGRELWDIRNGQLAFNDMLLIGQTQVAREESLTLQAQQFVVCDTSPLTTLFYSLALFGHAAHELEQMARRPYDLVFLCAPDFDFVQDGTRQDNEFRQRQHHWYLQELAHRNISYHELSGPPEQRLDLALTRIKQYLAANNNLNIPGNVLTQMQDNSGGSSASGFLVFQNKQPHA